ncbi:MAG TPA: CsbD family protein [Candidatus Angelobacter sp.]|jgi:uncharacterized protein YjbJ (UPF0337 family)|nr:CsbD family protein [Candidatus Angelobacter sp.]
MNSDQLAGKWKQLKGAAKEQWGKLTDDDLDVIDGKQEKLQGRLQERYGISKEAAAEQIKQWSARMQDSERDAEGVPISRRRAG